MKKILFLLLIVLFCTETYSQDSDREFEDCNAFPVSDINLNNSVTNLSNKILENRTLSVNYFNSLTKEQKIQLQNAIDNNNIPLIGNLSCTVNFLNNYNYLQTNYNQALSRIMELDSRLDSIQAKMKLSEIIECSLYKLSPNQNIYNELAKVDNCLDTRKKTERRADRDFGICTGLTVLGGIFGSFISLGGAVGVGIVAYERCVFNYATKLQDAKDDYEDCIKKL